MMEKGRDITIGKDVKEKGRDVKVNGKQFRLVFTTRAMLEVIDRFGGMDEAGEIIEKSKGRRALEEMAWLVALLANQGIALKNEDTGAKELEITQEQIILWTTPYELINLKKEVLGTLTDGMLKGQSKDEEEDEVLNEVLASKK